MAGVTLGMPGSWADSNYEAADIYTTKIGGLPDWPSSIVSRKANLLECSICGNDLCLLAQVYAPISSNALVIEDRLLFVFGCLNPECESISWRVYRVQKNSSNEAVHVASSPNNNRLENVCSFDFREEDTDDDDDIDLEELGRAFSEAASITPTSKKQNNSANSSKKSHPVVRLATPIVDNLPVLPCFYIYTQEEKLRKEITPESSKVSIQECDNHSEDPNEEETYEEESYEYDRALSADRTYLKFKKRMDLYPEQCLRYSLGGKPLLACAQLSDPGNCRLCGGARYYEMQLMPTLIYFLQEAANDQQSTCLEKFDWMTLLVFTCSKSCGESSCEEWTIAEEAIIVQSE